MIAIKMYGLLGFSILFLVTALIVGAATLRAAAQSNQGNGMGNGMVNSTASGKTGMNGYGYGYSGMVGGGNMGTSAGTGGMMGGSGIMGGCSGIGGDITDLKNAAGFDKAFLEAMIPHHQIALMMSNMVLVGGDKAELRTLAKSILTSQSAEIDQMRAWYAQWYGGGNGTTTP